MFKSSNGVICLLLVGGLAGCSAAPGVQGAQNIGASESYAAVMSVRRSDGPYVLGPGDRVRVKVYSDPDMSGEYEINSGGSVALPLVGDVKAAGLTTHQLEQAVASRMKGRVAQEPQVSIEIAAYAPFYIYGEVKKAGEYDYHLGLTVADAIATAGGLTYRADEHKIFLRRAGSKTEQLVSLDVPVRVYPGDNIRVAESFF